MTLDNTAIWPDWRRRALRAEGECERLATELARANEIANRAMDDLEAQQQQRLATPRHCKCHWEEPDGRRAVDPNCPFHRRACATCDGRGSVRAPNWKGEPRPAYDPCPDCAPARVVGDTPPYDTDFPPEG